MIGSQSCVRPNEANPSILKALKLLEQANLVSTRNLLNNEQKKILLKKIDFLSSGVKTYYDLEEKKVDVMKDNCDKLIGSLKSVYDSSQMISEGNTCLADINKEISYYQLSVQKKYNAINQISSSYAKIQSEIQLETEKVEMRRKKVQRLNNELSIRSKRIRNNLENSTEANNLRQMEIDKEDLSVGVDEMKAKVDQNTKKIAEMKATLKWERKKSIKTSIIECAKSYGSFKVLIPKTAILQKNINKLEAEVAAKKASGLLDDTILFDNTFVQASQIDLSRRDSNNSKSLSTNFKVLSGLPKLFESDMKQSQEKEISEPKQSDEPTEKETNKSPEKQIEQEDMEMEEGNEDEHHIQEQDEMEKGCEREDENDPEENKEQEANVTQESVSTLNIAETEEPMEEDDGMNLEEAEADDLNKSEEDVFENGVEEAIDEQDVNNNDAVDNKSDNGSPNRSQSFFDELLSTSTNKGKDAAEAIIDISNNSKDEAGDLLKEVENRINASSDDQMSQLSSENFSFNLFGNSNSNKSKNDANDNNDALGFSFGNGDGNDDTAFNFNLDAKGDDASDPFGFDKSTGDNQMDFNFNFNNDKDGGNNNASFFNFS